MTPLSRLVGVFGELLLTLGALVLAFVAWQLWWTDVAANASQREAVTGLERTFADQPADQPLARIPTPKPGEAFAVLRLPRLGTGYATPVYEGTDKRTLTQGVGHYRGTALPGEIGNFAVAGHRMTYGGPFRMMEELRAGDLAVVETLAGYAVYRLGPSYITSPDHFVALEPTPEHPGVAPTKASITLTACHPKYASTYRMIVHGTLAHTYPRSQGLPADLARQLGLPAGPTASGKATTTLTTTPTSKAAR